MFNYHDAYASDSIVPPQMMYIANHFGRYSEAKRRISVIMDSEAVAAGSAYADMLYYDPKLGSAPENSEDMDIYMPISEIAVMRSGWDKNDTYVGFHCDDPLSGEPRPYGRRHICYGRNGRKLLYGFGLGQLQHTQLSQLLPRKSRGTQYGYI